VRATGWMDVRWVCPPRNSRNAATVPTSEKLNVSGVFDAFGGPGLGSPQFPPPFLSASRAFDSPQFLTMFRWNVAQPLPFLLFILPTITLSAVAQAL
jgi:hypothetical protein